MDQSLEANELESLPLELAYPILMDLAFQDILRLCQVSTKLAWICGDWVFWADKAWHDFKFPRDCFDQTPGMGTSLRPP